MKDTIKQGITAGLLGTVGDTIIHWVAFIILGTTTTAHYILQLVYPFKNPTIARIFIGESIHYFAGAFVGIVLVIIYNHFGFDYPYYKSVGLSTLMWIIHIAIIPNIVSPRPYLLRTETETLVDLIAHLAYGIIAALYLLRTTAKQPS